MCGSVDRRLHVPQGSDPFNFAESAD